MWQVIAWIVATLFSFPVIAYILIYIIGIKIFKDKRRSTLLTFDVGAAILLFCIHFTSIVVFEKSLLGQVLLLSAIIFLLMGFLQKYHGRFSLIKVLKGGWRANGFLYLVGYIILYSYGLIIKIIE